jgi:hypothetical protein
MSGAMSALGGGASIGQKLRPPNPALLAHSTSKIRQEMSYQSVVQRWQRTALWRFSSTDIELP